MKKAYITPVAENIVMAAPEVMKNISGGNGNSGQDEDGGVGARQGFFSDADFDSDFDTYVNRKRPSLWDE